jgi:uncharacterized repeat protein (TIGR01451 family)/fimbrial isopeptide formation D2 family protein
MSRKAGSSGGGGIDRAIALLFATVALVLLLSPNETRANCATDPSTFSVVSHDLVSSYCELCGIGQIRILVTNPDNQQELTNIDVSEDLSASGLEYVPGSTTFNGAPAADPNIAASVLTWTPTEIPGLATLADGATHEIVFSVRATTAGASTPEDLVTAARTINASASFDFAQCPGPPDVDWPRTIDSTGPETLPLREPVPRITKLGRNIDAAQGTYAAAVYGNRNDDVIWRVAIANTGTANLEDLKFNDLMGAGSMTINYACPTEADALTIANNDGGGPIPADCVPASNTINDFAFDDPFGNPGNDEPVAFVDVPVGGTAQVFLVGKLANPCVNQTNTASGVEWGCEGTGTDGGIAATSTSFSPPPSSAILGSEVTNSGLTIQRQFVGVNDTIPSLGSRGRVIVTITNNTGGTVRNIRLNNVLPAEYVVDATFTPTITMTPAYGVYPGMTDTVVWDNPQVDPLNNTAPQFSLTSNGDVHPDHPAQYNLMRNGDQIVVTFHVVMIQSAYFDKAADLDVGTENPGDGTDPDNNQPASTANDLTVSFEPFCDVVDASPLPGPPTLNFVDTPQIDPEDLDINVSSPLYIVTNDPAYPVPLTALLTNNGGHAATNYTSYVTFGEQMEVVPTSVPAGCVVTSNPPARPVWPLPNGDTPPIPPTATVYECSDANPGLGPIAPGQTVPLTFQVIKRIPAVTDDLTFRADVIGEVRLNDGTPLTFPGTAPYDPIGSAANNYSLDGIRSRVLGFNLTKQVVGNCSEDNPPPIANTNVIIGEECSYNIESGGWFGFQTPGFNFIAVRNITVTDQLPNGQGYLTEDSSARTAGITVPVFSGAINTPPNALDEGNLSWSFNPTGSEITVAGELFQTDVRTRILNDPIDTSATPNAHALPSTNIAVTQFDAVFDTSTFTVNETTGVPGYPVEAVRRVDLTVTEPNLIVVKEVCNETLYGAGPGCSNWVPLANDGDTNDSYIYRITVTNEASSAGVQRAPAYNVISTDVLDPSDLLYILPFASDGLDNDGDGLVDSADPDEGSINDNTVNNATPAQITFSYSNSDALLRIDPGTTVNFYYRIDPDDAIAPLQTLTNTVTMSYDSLDGDYGSQTAPQRANGDIGGARVYTTTPQQAVVQILPVLTQPKQVINLSNTPAGGPPQPVSIGEEVEYQLTTEIPVSRLRNFVIRDELPAGIRCVEAPAVNLDAGVYASAGFVPGGIITPTCTSTGSNDYVEWNFGDQELTTATGTRFSFPVTFIARVDNSAGNNEATVISNGGGSTNATATYVDQTGTTVTLNFANADIVVREPVIALTKTFSVANTDAGDVLTVTVTATNTGTATAYNLRVMDDLVGTKLTFLNSVSGTDPPDTVDTTTYGANRPVFSWDPANPAYGIPVGGSVSFTFTVSVDDTVEPQEILANTIQGRWQSLPGQSTALNATGAIGPDGSATGQRNGAVPNAGDPINDYETTASATVTVLPISLTKTRTSDSFDATSNVRIGDWVEYELRVSLIEGTTSDVVLTDTLPQGMRFESITSINGDTVAPYTSVAPFTYTGFTAPTVAGDPVTGPTTVTWNLGDIVNAGDNDPANNDFVVVYRARVLKDVQPMAANIPLTNTVTLDYTVGAVPAPQLTDNETINVIQPNLTMTKSGPASVQFGVPASFTLDVQNIGTAPAYDLTITDRLPDLSPAAGGMCDTPPTVTAAGIYDGGGALLRTLTNGVDYVTSFTPAPACTLTIATQSQNAAVAPGERLIVTYEAVQDNDTLEGATLTNVAGATEWFSLDTAGAGATGETETYTRTITNGTAGTVDHEDEHTINAQVPLLQFSKSVVNQTTGQNPGTNASPGDTLRYSITVTNVSAIALGNFQLTDEVDRLSGGTALFAPGSLNIISVPAGADTTNTNVNGGSLGTGLLDVRNLSLDAAGGANDSFTIVFDVTLAPVITSGTVALNQAQIFIPSYTPLSSDDPNINGNDNPLVLGDEDPTATTIGSAPALQAQKVSQDLTGDPAVLAPGDTLRYTITASNSGSENSTNTTLRDVIPANTTYVAGSTRLNGAVVADVGGSSALEQGLLINDTANSGTPGFIGANNGASAVVTFDVTVNSGLLSGTILSNQATVSGNGSGSGIFATELSDDPSTPLANDPTQDVVGNGVIIDAEKTVSASADPVQPLTVLTYTIKVHNNGNVAATGVVLTDDIPANTGYVPNSTTLNGIAVPDAGGTTKLATSQGGLDVNSSDITPPAGPPAAGAGQINAGSSAVITFQVQVNAGVTDGTVISNQGTVATNEAPNEATDADGNDENGDQATAVIVGANASLAITKEVLVVSGGTAQAGGQLEYQIRVRNVGAAYAVNTVVTDTVPANTTYVTGSGLLNGDATGISFAAGTVSANIGTLAPNATALVSFRVTVNTPQPAGTDISNTGQVTANGGINETDSAFIDVGGAPGVANMSGRVWLDGNHDDVYDSGSETTLANWNVGIWLNGSLVDAVVTDANGQYQLNGLTPGATYEIRFSYPGSSVLFGTASATRGVAGPQVISAITLAAGENIIDQNLPVDATGVVYDSVARTPIAGATLTLLNAGSGLAVDSSCFDDSQQQNQVTAANGLYRFELNFSHATCPSGAGYLVQVTPPGGYPPAPSVIIPPTTGSTTAAYDVAVCSDDRVAPAPPAGTCEAQAQDMAPDVSIAAGTGTTYYLHLNLSNTATTNTIYNNHIPLDPTLVDAISLTKTTPMVNVTRGDLVPYTVTATNNLGGPLANNDIVDTIPPGFKYVAGSATINGVNTEPTVTGRELRWSGVTLPAGSPVAVKLILIVGAGVGEGDYINQAYVYNATLGATASGTASATVRVVPDPTFDCSDVIGKVFDDRNGNGYQDPGEPGLPGARVVTTRGLLIDTDKVGRYHIACAAVPNIDRGSNFILKLDTRSLPSGYRVTSENPRVIRLTRGKIGKINFGATIHRVVRLDIADAAFEPVKAKLRPEWTESLKDVIEQLKQGPSVLRLSYLGDAETNAMARARIDAVRKRVLDQWQALKPEYQLTVETELFWRRGAPGEGGAGGGILGHRDGVSFSRLDQNVIVSDIGENTEYLLPDARFTVWASDSGDFRLHDDDKVYFHNRTVEDVKTSEVQSRVDPISTVSGTPDIHPTTVSRLKLLLSDIGEGKRLRLHVTGHSDDQPLSEAEKARYKDRVAMTRAQAKITADYFQKALNLSADQVTYDGKGGAEPLESNATPEGRLANRRVEVKLWLEQVSERTINEPEVIPQPGVRRVRVCRREPACIVVRKVKDAKRLVVRKPVPPIRFTDESLKVPSADIEQLRVVVNRYRDKPNWQLRFTGHVDSLPISREAKARYGDKQGLSRAHARVVARQVQKALGLEDYRVVYEGAGDSEPLASNELPSGRAQNRRVEVSLWFDAPEDVLSVSEPQVCPVDEDGREHIAERYLPGGQDPIGPVTYRNGKPVINEQYLVQLKGLLERLQDKRNLRIVFAGYTEETLLNRRAAIAYGDNWGLSEARARTVRDAIQSALKLPGEMLSIEGKGFAESTEIDQGRVLQSPEGYVDVEIWFDVPAPRDDNVIAQLIRMQRKTDPVNPFALAPLRITVDGKRLDGSLPHTADVQRCTDVALDKTKIQLRYDGNRVEPRLDVIATPSTIAREDNPDTAQHENEVVFQGYSNYPAMIDKAEVRVFRSAQSLDDTPLAVVPLDDRLRGNWQAQWNSGAEVKFVLRVYDDQGRFDETRAKRIWVVKQAALLAKAENAPSIPADNAYGDSTLARRGIPVTGGSITVNTKGVPAGHRVYVMNKPVPIDRNGKLVSQQIIPNGLHTVEVAVLDAAGNGQLYLRDLGMTNGNWFYTGLADVTVGMDQTSGPASLVTGDSTHYNSGAFSDGRFAFYVKGTTKGGIEITTSADTDEGVLGDLFSSLTDKRPRYLFRRLDKDYEGHIYPTFGDDSVTKEDAPTQGKFYFKARKGNNFGLWGNFKAEWLDTDLARVDRGLYGAYGHYQSGDATGFGAARTRVDTYVAQPGTIRSREEFRGTGGSLYFLRHQDLTQGSESVWVEVRDQDSGLVLKTHRLAAGQDYSIDPIQGRIQLVVPLPSTADASQLVQAGALSGHPVYLVVHYEYAPGLTELNDTAVGLRTSRWVNDKVKLGLTYNNEDQQDAPQNLTAVDLTWRRSAATYLKFESATSEGLGAGEYRSQDGGYNFGQLAQPSGTTDRAGAQRVEMSAQLREFIASSRGRFTAYFQQREAGFSAPGQLTAKDTTQYGGLFHLPIDKFSDVNVKLDAKQEDLGLNIRALSADYGRLVGSHWKLAAGVRHDSREDNSPVVPLTQTEGDRTDAAVRMTYDKNEDWKAYYFAQATVQRTGTRNANNRLGGGGEYQYSDRLSLKGELSGGDLGMGARFGADYKVSDDSRLYSHYTLDNERDVSGLRAMKGNFTNGFRSQTSESMSVYGEERYTHGDVPTGLTHAYGVDLKADNDWRYGAAFEMGSLRDPNTNAVTDRTALSLSAGRTTETMRYTGAIEYRVDDIATSSRTTYLLKNRVTYQTDSDWRLFGKLNYSNSTSTQGEFYDGQFIETVFGYAFRPVDNDRWNTLLKYTYFYNLPSPDQVSLGNNSADYIQRSHVLAVDSSYDLNKRWTVGGKLAYRVGELSADRANPQFFASRGQLIALRADWHVVRNWDVVLEGRLRNELDAEDARTGVVVGAYRHMGNNLKLGGGYNFANFSDDLTNLDYSTQGLFINIVGKF